MIKSMRGSTLQTLGLGTVLEIFKNGKLPVDTEVAVEKVFGKQNNRGCLVISGANGIVGAGKAMQLGSRLEPFGVPVVGLDFPGIADAISHKYQGLIGAFGKKGADKIMSNFIRLSYDGGNLPSKLNEFKPRFLLEAIPEILDIKKKHYELFRKNFQGIEIRSVTSGFPSSELGVSIAHPSFPHEINKVWEIVEPQPSPVTHLLWALGLIPVQVSDDWSFVLDVLFCGITLSALRYHEATNMPFWKIDKYVRKNVGPNPFRAHDVIGAAGANFLTWSCLHHLSNNYGKLFVPTNVLIEHKDSGQNWYPPNHFRPVVNWSLNTDEESELLNWIKGSLYQMTSLLIIEKRSHLSCINAIGELCAQFQPGVIADIRKTGFEKTMKMVENYHRLYPDGGKDFWYPDVFEKMNESDWQQLYVNAEHDGSVGVITIGRESYNSDVDDELNRAIDWLKSEGIKNVIITGDFHLATQMVGADTNEFFPALNNTEEGFRVSLAWSKTARRLNDEFNVSVGFINGKRCLGGFLELLIHCHYLIAVQDAKLGMPEVTLPVVPGMEGCHWSFRKSKKEDWPKLLILLLEGKQVSAKEAVSWLVDYSSSEEDALKMAWKLVSNKNDGLMKRELDENALEGISFEIKLQAPENPGMESARKAIINTIRDSCTSDLKEALTIQAKHSANFMKSDFCKQGRIGAEYNRVMNV
jgi:enoyl-CoA hydratase/carnithine racemase